jgi:hypothetical protein
MHDCAREAQVQMVHRICSWVYPARCRAVVTRCGWRRRGDGLRDGGEVVCGLFRGEFWVEMTKLVKSRADDVQLRCGG